ncbi:MAG: type II toxin-antitoxin system RelE/ParE family toxin [Bacteroidales bacterium]|nr:type II toxin-antitoxin system RelE/ParE family toxin [Bacteroidales bacterium]
MRVRWNDESKKRLRQTAQYIRKVYGEKAKEGFLLEVRYTNTLLGQNPNMGPLETFLSDLPSKYRSIVVRSQNKIVYRVVDDHIEVVAFWDTRREPKKQAEQVEGHK